MTKDKGNHWFRGAVLRPHFLPVTRIHLRVEVSAVREVLDWLNTHVLWGPPMVVALLTVGVFLTAVTKGMLFRRFGVLVRYTVGSLFRRKGRNPAARGAISPFQAVCTALAATVGTGNIVGVGLAIAVGGPGALFWLWVSALVGMVLKYAEVTLAVAYRTVGDDGQVVGGPMYYIEKGLGRKGMARLFAFFGWLASFGIGAGVQANALAGSLRDGFGLRADAVGVVTALLAGLVIIGGIRRIAAATRVLVPFMSLFYMVGAAVVLVRHGAAISSAFAQVFEGAFHGTAAVGGFAGASVGYACRIGMARGVFTHEGGMGSAPIAHASAATDHPARQGLWGAFEVFFDSVIMCTVTGLVILTTDSWQAFPMPQGAALCAAAFSKGFFGGGYVVYVGMVLFAFATIIAWFYYGERCAEYLSSRRQWLKTLYPFVYVLVVFGGCVAQLDAVWAAADLFNGLMALPNLAALVALSSVVGRLSKDFFRHPHHLRKDGEDFTPLLVFGRRKKSLPEEKKSCII